MARLSVEAEKLHYQWSEKESWKRAHEAARKAYYESMTELGYADLEKEVPAIDRAVMFFQEQARKFTKGNEPPKPTGLGLSFPPDSRAA
ncbi:MAG: hypothetical protein O2795_17925 [Acidobacteria bacterium]|nr:hypothetical protein [Acidobacteriota bacterium]